MDILGKLIIKIFFSMILRYLFSFMLTIIFMFISVLWQGHADLI